MIKSKDTFGSRVRQKRMDKPITLTKFAEMIGVSPTYISQIERDRFNPPSDDKIRKIAKVLEEDEDEMMALAERFPSDLLGIFQRQPKGVTTFLRTAKGFSKEDWETWTRKIGKNSTEERSEDQ